MSSDLSEYLLVLIGVTGTFLLACACPGPSFVVISSTAATTQRRLAVLAGLGVAAATFTWAAAAALGLGLLLADVPWLYWAIRVVGATYIILLGLQMLLMARRNQDTSECVATPASGPLHHFGRGYFVAVSNPAAAVLFGSLFSTMLPPATPPLVYAWAALLVTLASVGWHCGVAAIFSARRIRIAYRRSERQITALVGAVIVALGVRLMVSG